MDLNNIFNKSFVDIPSSKPKVRIPIPYVGMSNRPHYIKIIDPFNSKKEISLLADIRVLANLPKLQRGLHMSRFEECLHKLDASRPKDLRNYVKKLCLLAKETQAVNNCKVEVIANYEKNVEEKNGSGKASHELIKLIVDYEINKNKEIIEVGMIVPFINACPCTQRRGMRDFYKYLQKKKLDKKTIEELIKNAPLQAHTNGGTLQLSIKSDKVKIRDIYHILEKTSPIVRELLKGPDEHTLVKASHKLGLFCEDLAREAALNTALHLKTLTNIDDTKVRIEVDADESVHFHNLYCEIDATLGDLKKILKDKD